MVSKHLRIIIPYLEMGGTERHLSLLLPELARKGWMIKLLVLTSHLPLKDYFSHPNIVIKHLPSSSSSFLPPFRHLWHIFKLLVCEFRQDPTSLTHFFLPKAYLIGMPLAKLCRVKGPLVMSRRSLNFYQKRHRILYLERFLHPFCTLILANSLSVKTQLNTQEKVPESHLHLVYNGIEENPPPLKEKKNPQTDHKEDEFHMTMVANLIFYKGHLDLFRALNLIYSELPKNWTLTLVGQDRGLLSSLKKQATLLGLSQHINWILNSQDPTLYLQSSDIGILPSHEEGFSNALLEMMRVGLPVVATRVGGNAEAVLHAETGLLVSPQAPQELAEAILLLARDKTLRKSMGTKALKHFQEHFTLSQCVQAYDNLYQRLLFPVA